MTRCLACDYEQCDCDKVTPLKPRRTLNDVITLSIATWNKTAFTTGEYVADVIERDVRGYLKGIGIDLDGGNPQGAA